MIKENTATDPLFEATAEIILLVLQHIELDSRGWSQINDLTRIRAMAIADTLINGPKWMMGNICEAHKVDAQRVRDRINDLQMDMVEMA